MAVLIVLDRERFEEIRGLLGPARFGTAIGAFRSQLDHTLAMTVAPPPQEGSLHTLAHQVASSAGSLGFNELSSTSRNVLSLGLANSVTSDLSLAVKAMHDATRRALLALAEVAA